MSNPTVKQVDEQLSATQANVEALGKTVDSVVESVEALDKAITEQDTKIEALSESAKAQDQKLGQVLEILMKNQHSMDPAEHDVNEYGMAEVVNGPDGDPVVAKSPYKDVDSPEFKAHQDYERFLREPVDIFIQPSPERNADPFFMVGVNGRSRVFHRNREYKNVPRCFVEAMARARPVHYDNEEYTKPNGEQAVRNPSRRGLRYHFQVTRDSEQGRKWLQAVMSQP